MHQQVSLVCNAPQFDGAGHRIELYCSAITIAVNGLDAGRGSLFEKNVHRGPVQWRPVRQPQRETASVPRILHLLQLRLQSSPIPNLRRRLSERGKHGVVELPDAAKPRGKSDLSDRQFRFFNQPGREMNSPRFRDCEGRNAQMLGKQPAEVT